MSTRLPYPTVVSTALVAGMGVMLGVGAGLKPPLAIAAAAGLAFVALAVVDLAVGVALFTFAAFLDVLPGFGALSTAKLAGGVLVLCWLATNAAQPGLRGQFTRVHAGATVLMVVFIAWVLVGALWAEVPGNVFVAVTRYLPNLLLLPILFTAVRSGRDVRIILLAFVIGALISTAYGAFVAPGDADAAAEGRVTGAGIDPNYLATALVASLAICGGALATRTYPAVVRFGALVGLLILVAALVATASRTGMFAVVGASVAAIAMAGRGRRLPALILVGFTLAFAAAYVAEVAPPAVRTRLLDVSGGGGSGRTDIWTVGLRMAKANAITGVGADNYYITAVHYLLEPGALRRDDLILDTPKVAHNVYLQVWAELGLVGAVLFFAIVAFAIRCTVRAAHAFDRAGDASMALLARSVVVAQAGMLTAALFVSLQYDKPIWLMLALGPCLLALSRRRQRRTA